MELIVIAALVVFVGRQLRRRNPVPDAGAIVGPVGWTPELRWSVVRPLARADLRRLLRHPAFLAGVALTPLMVVGATADQTRWREISAWIALSLVPLGWMTIIATNLVALRPRRTGADELFSVLPAGQPARTTALLATMVGPVTIAAIFGAAAAVAIGAERQHVHGTPKPTEMAAGLLIVAGSVGVGVAVGRWLPRAGFGLLAVVATILIQARFLDVNTWPWNRGSGDPMRFLGFLAEPAQVGADFLEIRPAGWHLLYLAALVVVVAGVALARDGFATPVAIIVGSGVLVAGIAGFVQTRPLSDAQEDAMVALLSEPATHQVCSDSGGVRYCAYTDFIGHVPEWRDRVDATLAALPVAAVARGRLDVVQRPATIVGASDCTPVAFEDGLPPDVAARLTPNILWPQDRHVHPPLEEESFPCSDRDVDGFFLAVQTGAWATGLPPAPHHDDRRCTAGGQARSAIALWAAAAATPDGADTLHDLTTDGAADGASMITFADWDSPPMWGVDYAVADAHVAQAMLEVPTAEIRATLEDDWGRWTDPTTATSELAEALGLDRPADSPTTADAGCP